MGKRSRARSRWRGGLELMRSRLHPLSVSIAGLSSNSAVWEASLDAISTLLTFQETSTRGPISPPNRYRSVVLTRYLLSRSPASSVWGANVPEGEMISEDSPLVSCLLYSPTWSVLTPLSSSGSASSPSRRWAPRNVTSSSSRPPHLPSRTSS